jgi:hypothetical protein
MSSRRPKYINTYSKYLTKDPNTRYVLEFDIPNFVTYEDQLLKLTEKLGLQIVHQIRYGSKAPTTRMLTGEANFTTTSELDELLSKIHRSFKKQSITISRVYAAIEFPKDFNIDKLDSAGSIGRAYSSLQIFCKLKTKKELTEVTLEKKTPTFNYDKDALMIEKAKLYSYISDEPGIYYACFDKNRTSINGGIQHNIKEFINKDLKKIKPLSIEKEYLFTRAVLVNI